MKNKLLIGLLVSTSIFLIGCSKNELKTEGLSSVEQINNNDKNTKDNEITKDDAQKIHEETVVRLQKFYQNHKLPYHESNVYNTEVEVSELALSFSLAEQTGLDLKNITGAKYDLTEKFAVNAAIEMEWDANMILSKTIVPEYIQTITNEFVNLERFDDVISTYVADPNTNSISENFDIAHYNINIYMSEINRLLVTIKSNYNLI